MVADGPKRAKSSNLLGLARVGEVEMRRIAILVALTLAGLGLLAQPAWATFHLNKVNEVMLASGSGDASVQFVEFLDKGGTEEEFTPAFAPSKIVVYDAGGNKLREHTLDPARLPAAAGAGPRVPGPTA